VKGAGEVRERERSEKERTEKERDIESASEKIESR